jgi:hypothetical protein
MCGIFGVIFSMRIARKGVVRVRKIGESKDGCLVMFSRRTGDSGEEAVVYDREAKKVTVGLYVFGGDVPLELGPADVMLELDQRYPLDELLGKTHQTNVDGLLLPRLEAMGV